MCMCVCVCGGGGGGEGGVANFLLEKTPVEKGILKRDLL